MTAMTKVEYVRGLIQKKKKINKIFVFQKKIISLLDKAPNYLFGCVDQKWLYKFLNDLFWTMHPTTYLGALSKRDDQDQKIVKSFPHHLVVLKTEI